MISPDIRKARARPSPMRIDSVHIAPRSGISPILTKAEAKRASRPATTKSQAAASAMPPPTATPSTAAITGLGASTTPRIISCMCPSCSGAVSAVRVDMPFTSPPAQKWPPSPAITIARQAGSAPRIFSPSISSACSFADMALRAAGLSRISVPIPVSSVRRTPPASSLMGLSSRSSLGRHPRRRRGCPPETRRRRCRSRGGRSRTSDAGWRRPGSASRRRRAARSRPAAARARARRCRAGSPPPRPRACGRADPGADLDPLPSEASVEREACMGGGPRGLREGAGASRDANCTTDRIFRGFACSGGAAVAIASHPVPHSAPRG